MRNWVKKEWDKINECKSIVLNYIIIINRYVSNKYVFVCLFVLCVEKGKKG